MDVSGRVTQAQRLLAALPGPYGNGYLRTLIEDVRQDSICEQVFAFLTQTTASSGADARAPWQVPCDATELASAVHEVDRDDARAVFEGLATRTLAYRTRGPYSQAEAAALFRALAGLLGPSARWFSNTDLVTWHPVTGYTMDALLAGTGGGVLIAVLATDKD